MLNTMFELDARPDQPDARRVLGHGDTGSFIDASDINAMYEYLSRHGVVADAPVVTSYGMTQLQLKDPDGYGICFNGRLTNKMMHVNHTNKLEFGTFVIAGKPRALSIFNNFLSVMRLDHEHLRITRSS